jgi:NAD(P)-dependent dehydrogenase (short-subunit alcohol dehydrogenase family)
MIRSARRCVPVANKGLGFATARLLLAGHTVWIASRDLDRGRRAAAELGALAVQLDVTDDASVTAAAKTVEVETGLDVLINTAGIQAEMDAAGVASSAAELTADVVARAFDTNVVGTVRVLHAFLPLLQHSPAPVVVNVSSGLASLTRASSPGAQGYAYQGVAYPASKTALNRITVHYAKAFPAMRIKAVAPGFTRTALNGNTGKQTVEQGATVIAHFAQIGPDGPTGGYLDTDGTLPW